MPFEVRLPDIGEGVAEGEIVRWLVKRGDVVREDQPLVEVMTDKANVEIPSPRAGTIAALHVEEGAVVPVGTVLVSIEVPAGRPGSAGGPAGSATLAGAAQQRGPLPGRRPRRHPRPGELRVPRPGQGRQMGARLRPRALRLPEGAEIAGPPVPAHRRRAGIRR